jgi:hypothetical protein
MECQDYLAFNPFHCIVFPDYTQHPLQFLLPEKATLIVSFKNTSNGREKSVENQFFALQTTDNQ